MAESMTMTAPPTVPETPCVALEDDAAPLVRLIGRTLRDAVRLGHARDELDRTTGTVVVRSHDTPQAATLTFGDAGVAVQGGADAAPDAAVVVNLHARFAPVGEWIGDTVLAGAVLAALQLPLPHWRAAAARFWAQTRDIKGIPDVLLVRARSRRGVEHGRFGDGPAQYLIDGPEDLLAGVFSGTDDFLESLTAGVRVRGTLSQMSVMTAASWRVRFDV